MVPAAAWTTKGQSQRLGGREGARQAATTAVDRSGGWRGGGVGWGKGDEGRAPAAGDTAQMGKGEWVERRRWAQRADGAGPLRARLDRPSWRVGTLRSRPHGPPGGGPPAPPATAGNPRQRHGRERSSTLPAYSVTGARTLQSGTAAGGTAAAADGAPRPDSRDRRPRQVLHFDGEGRATRGTGRQWRTRPRARPPHCTLGRQPNPPALVVPAAVVAATAVTAAADAASAAIADAIVAC